jgi:hypothetical protein
MVEPRRASSARASDPSAGPRQLLGAWTASLLVLALVGCGGSEAPRRGPDFSSSFEPPADDEGFAELDRDGLPPEDEDVPPIDFPSCDQAREDNPDSIDLANRAKGPPDVPASEYSAILGRGSYLDSCHVPSSAAVTVCAAVREGKAIGITVTMSPHRQSIVNCLVEAIQGLGFPSHPKLDVATTRFAPGG